MFEIYGGQKSLKQWSKNQRLVVNDRRENGIESRIRDARGLVVRNNVDRGDLAAFHGHVQLDFAAQTVADALEGVSHRGHAGHQHRHDENESKDLLHGKSPLSK